MVMVMVMVMVITRQITDAARYRPFVLGYFRAYPTDRPLDVALHITHSTLLVEEHKA